ncbi:MAG: peptidase T [Crocinitomicaceae bacterium]
MEHIASRFMRYVQIDTTADPNSTSFPSSEKQKNLGKLLTEELRAFGLKQVEMDDNGYVIATISGNTTNQNAPCILLCSHMDTAPDCSGTDVKPILHRSYNGAPIVLPDDPSQVITIERHPYLKEKIGDDLITASGLTLLGADDKAGIAIIMDFVQQLTTKQFPHGDIQVLFTPDEEVGRGVDYLDMNKITATYGYTLDGGPLGDIEDETFSADGMKFVFTGVSAHPGYAKGKMINAIKLASAFVSRLPKEEWSPETTSGREGFVHPVSIQGGLEEATVQFILRDHDTEKMNSYADKLTRIANEVLTDFPGAHYRADRSEQYRNMKEKLVDVPFVTEYAVQAMERAGVQPRRAIIRGGTDGSRLSFMGVPCPNLFTGEMAIHSKHEYVSVQDMEKAVESLVELIQIWERHEG